MAEAMKVFSLAYLICRFPYIHFRMTYFLYVKVLPAYYLKAIWGKAIRVVGIVVVLSTRSVDIVLIVRVAGVRITKPPIDSRAHI